MRKLLLSENMNIQSCTFFGSTEYEHPIRKLFYFQEDVHPILKLFCFQEDVHPILKLFCFQAFKYPC
jgi:hypothetical protein